MHAGSLVAALASWLDARAHSGLWLVRMEDVDVPRCIAGMDEYILQQLARCGLTPDAQVMRQTTRTGAYQQALDSLSAQGRVYPCACSRKDIEQAVALQNSKDVPSPRRRNTELVYPGTCSDGVGGRPARSWRFRTDSDTPTEWVDRRLGAQNQNVKTEVGDFVLKRADGLFAYQLAVVVDDAAQGVTHVVRGADLTDNTARQMALQAALGLPTPRYLHTPLVLGFNGEKLSKQNGASALDISTDGAALNCLIQAARTLGLNTPRGSEDPSSDNTALTQIAHSLAQWVAQWRKLYTDA